MREINVWGGVHGDEWESQALIHALRSRARREPGLPVHARIAHSAGHGFHRIGEHNLAFAFGRKTDGEPGYEEVRAAEIVKRSRGAYATIDAHQIMLYGVKTAYVDLERGVSPTVLGFLQSLGITSLVATEGWGMQGHVHNACILESRYRPGRERVEVVDAIRRLSYDTDHPTAKAGDFDWYKYAATIDTRLGYPSFNDPESTFKALEKISDEAAAALGVNGLALHVLNWRDVPMRNGVWGELATPIPAPDSDGWPE